MKKLIILIVLLSLSWPVFAQDKRPPPKKIVEPIRLDEETIQLANRTILNIFDEISLVKNKYPELQNFDKSALTPNKYGIFEIAYENRDFSGAQATPYSFKVTIVGIAEDPYRSAANADKVVSSFPLLGFKITGYQTRNGPSRYLLSRAVEKNTVSLYEHQQKYIPLQLSIAPAKNVYKVGERIAFTVTLKNNGTQNLKVQSLNDGTLFFTIDNKVWGTQPDQMAAADTTKEIVLGPGRSISRGFKGDSFSMPQTVQIYCTYNRGYRGVLPMASVRLQVVKE